MTNKEAKDTIDRLVYPEPWDSFKLSERAIEALEYAEVALDKLDKIENEMVAEIEKEMHYKERGEVFEMGMATGYEKAIAIIHKYTKEQTDGEDNQNSDR